MGNTVLTAQNKWCNGVNCCQLQLFLEEVRLEYNEDDDEHDDHLVNKTNLVHSLFLVCLSISTRFGPSGRTGVFMRHLVLVILCRRLSGMQAPCIPESHLHRITSTKCRINTAVPPDDGTGVARSM